MINYKTLQNYVLYSKRNGYIIFFILAVSIVINLYILDGNIQIYDTISVS